MTSPIVAVAEDFDDLYRRSPCVDLPHGRAIARPMRRVFRADLDNLEIVFLAGSAAAPQPVR